MRVNFRTEWPHWALLAAMFLLAAITWPIAPDRIPVHWNAMGQIDRYGGKVEGLLLLPALSLAIYLLLLLLPKIDPGRANYDRFSGPYAMVRLAVLVVMAGIYGVTHLVIRGYPIDMAVVVPLLVGGLFILLGNYMGKIRPNWFVGIRTPWTLSSKLAWSKTHRLGGRLFIALGVALIVVGALHVDWAAWVVIALVLLMVVWSFVYSYMIWKNDPDKQPPAGTLPG